MPRAASVILCAVRDEFTLCPSLHDGRRASPSRGFRFRIHAIGCARKCPLHPQGDRSALRTRLRHEPSMLRMFETSSDTRAPFRYRPQPLVALSVLTLRCPGYFRFGLPICSAQSPCVPHTPPPPSSIDPVTVIRVSCRPLSVRPAFVDPSIIRALSCRPLSVRPD